MTSVEHTDLNIQGMNKDHNDIFLAYTIPPEVFEIVEVCGN